MIDVADMGDLIERFKMTTTRADTIAQQIDLIADLLERAEQVTVSSWVSAWEKDDPVFCPFCGSEVVPLKDGRWVCTNCHREIEP